MLVATRSTRQVLLSDARVTRPSTTCSFVTFDVVIHTSSTLRVRLVASTIASPVGAARCYPFTTAMGRSLTAFLEMPAEWHVFTTCVTSL